MRSVTGVDILQSKGHRTSLVYGHLHWQIPSQDSTLAGKRYHRDLRHDRRICFSKSFEPVLLGIGFDTNGRIQRSHTFSSDPNDQHTRPTAYCMKRCPIFDEMEPGSLLGYIDLLPRCYCVQCLPRQLCQHLASKESVVWDIRRSTEPCLQHDVALTTW